jgi:hypothetical protein
MPAREAGPPWPVAGGWFNPPSSPGACPPARGSPLETAAGLSALPEICQSTGNAILSGNRLVRATVAFPGSAICIRLFDRHAYALVCDIHYPARTPIKRWSASYPAASLPSRREGFSESASGIRALSRQPRATSSHRDARMRSWTMEIMEPLPRQWSIGLSSPDGEAYRSPLSVY